MYQLVAGVVDGVAQVAGFLSIFGVFELGIVADDTTGDVDGNEAVVGIVAGGNNFSVVSVINRHEIGSHGGQTSTAVDGAQHGATGDIHVDVAADDTGRLDYATESAATAENIAVDIGGAKGANKGCDTTSG